MHLEFITLEIILTETGQKIPLELIFVTSDRDSDRLRMTNKIRHQMDSAAKGRPYKISYYVLNRYPLDNELYQ